MKSPLAIDKETVKKYNIKDDVPPQVKISYLQEQLGQFYTMVWRARVDIVHATRLTESDNETLKQRGHQQLSTHYNEVQQVTGAIENVKTMIGELRKEYPELAVED